MSFFKKIFSKAQPKEVEKKKESLDKGLEKTKTSFFTKLSKVVAGKSKVDDEVLDNLEEILVSSDVGVETTLKIIDGIEERVAKDKYFGTDELNQILREEIASLLSLTHVDQNSEFSIATENKPYVIMVVGVNGVGKTTTIGKLASQFKNQGLKVVLGAADTFRAAAIEQLEVWAERTDAEFVKHEEGSDAASVVYDAYEAAKARDCDVLLVDTAGRLHNKEHLMEELKKIVRILQKHDASLPHESVLVIDGNTGQNTVNQIKRFNHAIPLDGLIVTKLDGTAKGGSVISMSNELKLPIDWLGVGESVDDLVPFSKDEYIKGLFSTDE